MSENCIFFTLITDVNHNLSFLIDNMQVKAYTTRVGSGPFPTEIMGKGGDLLRSAGKEFGTTTGRPRRCGWLDIVALKYCCQINGFSSLNLTKLDVLSDLPEIELGISYKQLDNTPIQSFPSDLDFLEQIKASFILFFVWVPLLNLSFFLLDLEVQFIDFNYVTL